MPNSLIDFGGATNNAIQLGQLQETSRRNDLYEKNSLLQAEAQNLEKVRLKQSASFRAFDEIDKVRSRPEFAMNQNAQINFTLTQGQLLGGILGKPVPMPSADELRGGYEEITDLMKTMRTGDPTQKLEAFQKAMVANPVWAGRVLDDMKKAGDLTTQMEEMDLKLGVHKAQLEALNLKNSQSTLRFGAFMEHAGALAQSTSLGVDPSIGSQFRQVLSLKTPQQQQAYLAAHPEFKVSFAAKIEQEKKRMGFFEQIGSEPLEPGVVDALQVAVDAKRAAFIDAQSKSPDGKAPMAVAEDLHGMNLALTARRVQAEWLSDPFNKDKWKLLQKAEQDLRVAATKEQATKSDIAEERQALLQAKFDKKVAIDENTSRAGVALLQELDGVDVTNEAKVQSALAKVTKPYAESGLVDVGKLAQIINNVKGTGAKIYNYDPKQSVAEAGQLANVMQSVNELGTVRKIIIKPNGEVDRLALASSAANLIFSEGRTSNTLIRKAIEIKLRAATGAAAPKHEVDDYERVFAPSIKDRDELVKYKLDALEEWMQSVVDITDPAGSLRKRKDSLLSPNETALLSSDEYKQLRKIDPHASSMELMRFLKYRKATSDQKREEKK